MDTTTDRPATSPGDGRGEKGSAKSEPRDSMGAGSSTEKEPSMSGRNPEAELLAADGTRVPIESARERAMRSGRQAGRYASDSWKKISHSAEELGKTNPTGLALGALAVGLVAGVLVGALLARD
jgi:hypothetical protein